MRVKFSFFLFSLIFLLFYASVGLSKSRYSKFLNISVRLDLVSHNTLKGTLWVRLSPKRVYTFLTKGLIIEEVKLNKLKYKEKVSYSPGIVRVFSGRYGASLEIRFKKKVSPGVIPITIVNPPFPIPNTPFTFKARVFIPRGYKLSCRIPCEYESFHRKRWWKEYIFRTDYPVKNPVLVFASGYFKDYPVDYQGLRLKFYYLTKDQKERLRSLKENLDEVNIPFLSEINGIKGLSIFVTEDLPVNLKFSSCLFVPEKVLDKPVNFLHLLVKRILLERFFNSTEDTLEGFAKYLVDYQLSQNPRLFRKYALAFPKSWTPSFFYLVELESIVGKNQVISALEDYFNSKTNYDLKEFYPFLRGVFPQKLAGFPSFSSFSKVKLSGKVDFIVAKSNGYSVHLLLHKYPVFTTGAPEGRLAVVPLKVYCGNAIYYYQIPMYSSVKEFTFTCSQFPKKILIDPEYQVWRVLTQEEMPISFESLLRKKGVLVFSPSVFPVYKNFVNYFLSLGYKSRNHLNLQEFPGKNVIYFQSSPLFWQFNPPNSGFYFKVLPNFYSPGSYVGFIYASSMSQAENAMKVLQNFKYYSEGIIDDGKILSVKKDPAANGIKIRIKKESVGIELNDVLTPELLARKLTTTQLILIGENTSANSTFLNFYSGFLNSIYSLNSRLILVIDVSRSLNPILEEYLKGGIPIEQVLSSLSPKDSSIKTNTLKYVLSWAKSHHIKVVAGGLENQILQDFMERGIEGLSQEELLKLPEVDFFDPAFKFFLKRCFSNSTGNFTKFFQAQELKKETLAETILHTLQNNKTYQVVVITNEFKVAYPWTITASLLKRGLIGFKTIILDDKLKLDPELADYFFSGGINPAEVVFGQ